MNRKRLLTLFSTFLFLSILISPIEAKSFVAEKGVVSVSSTKFKEVEPNRANVDLTIETSAKTAKEASEKNKNVTNSVISVIKSEISPNSSDYIRTSTFVVMPEYYWKDNKKILNSYVAKNTIYVSTSNINNVGKIIDLAVSAGANKIDRFSLSLENENTSCTSLLADATKETFLSASSIARAIGHSIDRPKNISTSCYVNSGNQNYNRAMMSKTTKMDNATGSNTKIESGKIKIEVTVNSEYYLK